MGEACCIRFENGAVLGMLFKTTDKKKKEIYLMAWNWNRLALAILAAFAFIFAYDWLWHGVLMHDWYQQTAHLWRPESDMNQYCAWMIASQMLIAGIMGWIFLQGYENRGLGEGFRFGLYMGGLFAAFNLGMYAWMPVPLHIVLAWVAGMMLQGIGTGLVFAGVYRPLNASAGRAAKAAPRSKKK